MVQLVYATLLPYHLTHPWQCFKMTLTFYYVPHSTANVTAAVLDELEYGLPNPLAKRIELSIQAGDTQSPHYLSTVNPKANLNLLKANVYYY